jgi:S-adenosylmethionine:tRNA ribosyltransferase-isomerase
MNRDIKTSSYNYTLPKELIATSPAKPADSAKLLVYNRATKEITHTTFKNLLDFIPKDTAIFLNNTKVIKARVFGKKSSGGKVELLVIREIGQNRFLVMIKGKVKVGTILEFEENLSAKVEELNSDGSRVVSFYIDNQKIDFNTLVTALEKIGHIPLPPYMNREDKKEDELDYQTLFAKEAGSVAAPTASLHFTPELLERLKENFETYYLTLHVGAGTFKPVDVEDILEHQMHSEVYNIPKEAAKVIDSNQKILAVGTTSTRTIEYYARVKKLSGECDLFLHPNNKPIRVNYLLTNFHLPKSTLIMLVSAFLGRDETLKVYNEAIKNHYKFYSYGDAMLII